MRRLGWFLNEHGMWQARPWLVWVLQRVFGLDVIPAVERAPKDLRTRFSGLKMQVAPIPRALTVKFDGADQVNNG
jgi:hypothetical protein